MSDPITQWAETVRREHLQADRVRSDSPGEDHWKNLAHRFRPMDRERAMSDETLLAVREFVGHGDTVLDVGAGAGRLAVPLATLCQHVTAVEPSEAMQSSLRDEADAWGLDNLSVIGARWQEAEVDSAAVVICAHVVYTVEEIEPFLRKLTSSSSRDVIVIVFEEPAMANYFPLWERVYGEERIPLPSLPELKQVLSAMGVDFSSNRLPEWRSRPFADRESAYRESLARLFLSERAGETDKIAQRLRTALEESLVDSEDGLLFRWARPHRPWLVNWTA